MLRGMTLGSFVFFDIRIIPAQVARIGLTLENSTIGSNKSFLTIKSEITEDSPPGSTSPSISLN